MVVGFTTTYAISAYHHYRCGFESCSWRSVVDTTFCDKVCQRQWFSPGTPVSSTIKTDCQNITEILLKVALNTITLTMSPGTWWFILTDLFVQYCTAYIFLEDLLVIYWKYICIIKCIGISYILSKTCL